LNQAKVSFAKFDFENAKFKSAQLSHADFEGASLKNCDLRNATLRRSNLKGANLSGANLTGAKFGLDGIFDVKDGIMCVEYSNDGKLVICGCTNGRVFLLSNTGSTSISAHVEDVNCLAFSPDGKYFASGGKDRTIKVWSIATKKAMKLLKGHEGPVWGLSYAPNGKYLASCGNDGNV